MVFEPIEAAGGWLRAHIPTRIVKPTFNFITVHYMYMLGWTIVGAILLYPAGLMGFTNALFFAAGASTQSGLNPININDLYLYQQIILMLIACVANPIFINTAVVFVRLYWFEKRFQYLVKEVRNQRRSRSRTMSRQNTEALGESDPGRLERGVNGRQIKVLHDTTKPNGMNGTVTEPGEAEREFAEKLGLNQTDTDSAPASAPTASNHSSEVGRDETMAERQDQQNTTETSPSTEEHFLGRNPQLQRDIKFADETPRDDLEPTQSGTPVVKVTEGSDVDRHIKFVERQHQNAHKESGTLRIPGPRDFDRGEVPKELDESDDELNRPRTRDTFRKVESEQDRSRRMSTRSDELNADDHPRRGITIDAPDHPGHRGRNSEDAPAGESNTIRETLSRVKSGLSHRRNRSRNLNLADAKGSMARTFSSMTTARSRGRGDIMDPMPYLSWQPTVGRNSAFSGLSPEQREELGGIEYRALKTLAKILILYYIGFHVLGMMCLLPWILHTKYWKNIVLADGIAPGWWGVFTPASMFTDLGFTLTPDSMESFQEAILPLLLGSFLIIIGNTGFPCMLRFVIWVATQCTPYGSHLWEELRFLLDHPRRCFTLLFPSRATWWLFWILVLLNGIDLIFFIILDLHDPTVTSLPPGYRVLNGWFQATSTRTAGFACVNLANLHPAIQVSYLVMMYISVFPIAISVRRTNVYEEKSLGIWGGEEANPDDPEQSYVGQHLRRQLSFDLWYVFLGFFVIAIVEGKRIQDPNEPAFNMFAVLFEIVSAYGTVGLSLGYPTNDMSFSAEFAVLSKLVIIAMMIRGRHRGLPYALDRAILLPSENLHKKDDEATIPRRNSIYEPQNARRWEDGELDEAGLPMQHTGADRDPMTAGAGGEHSPEGMRRPSRRMSSMTSSSQEGVGERRRKHDRARSFGTIIASGLSAGPTLPKKD